MTQVTVRKSGGAKIITLPAQIADSINIDIGDKLEVTEVDGKIWVTQVSSEPTLEQMIASSPPYKPSEEDSDWMNMELLESEL